MDQVTQGKKKLLGLVTDAHLVPIITVNKIGLDYIYDLVTLLIFIKGLHKSFIIPLIFKLTTIINEVLLLSDHLPLKNCYSFFFLEREIVKDDSFIGRWIDNE